MSELDDKLSKIVNRERTTKQVGLDRAVAQIKQAFADAGYQPIAYTVEDGTRVNLLSGQEWYDRFEKNLQKVQPDLLLKNPALEVVLVAAKRASGL